jgi:hypothetical protein
MALLKIARAYQLDQIHPRKLMPTVRLFLHRVIPFPVVPMELSAHGAKKYPASALLQSSAGLGWSTISAELRSHGPCETPVIVSQNMELCFAVSGNGLVRRTGAGQCQETVPRTGTIWLSPVGIGDNDHNNSSPSRDACRWATPLEQSRAFAGRRDARQGTDCCRMSCGRGILLPALDFRSNSQETA